MLSIIIVVLCEPLIVITICDLIFIIALCYLETCCAVSYREIVSDHHYCAVQSLIVKYSLRIIIVLCSLLS